MNRRTIILLLVGVIAAVAPQILITSTVHARVVSLACVCLFIWLSELAPPFVPTLMLWALVPLLLGPVGSGYDLVSVLGWAADPVMALFFGGFALGLAAERYALGARIMSAALRFSGDSYGRFLLAVILMTAFFSMWISNIAAAALIFACLSPVIARLDDNDILRRMLLIGVALGANFGGIATPVGTGPNAIAVASIEGEHTVSFAGWMAFAFPLTLGLLLLSFVLLLWRVPHDTRTWHPEFNAPDDTKSAEGWGRRMFPLLLAATVAMWLAEPLHGISSATIAVASAAVLFLSGMLLRGDLARIDWSTLLLIAGGITLGRLLEHSAIVTEAASRFHLAELHPVVALLVISFTSAALSSLMSNTATTVLLIPLAASILPGPSTAILIAVSASLGVTFLISTPPNAMAFGQRGVKFGDLFWPGITLMLIGCILVTLTGKTVLNIVGIP